MNGGDTGREIAAADPLETAVLHAPGEFRLIGELADAFDQILIGLTVLGY